MRVLFASISKKKNTPERSAYDWRAVTLQVWNYLTLTSKSYDSTIQASNSGLSGDSDAIKLLGSA